MIRHRCTTRPAARTAILLLGATFALLAPHAPAMRR